MDTSNIRMFNKASAMDPCDNRASLSLGQRATRVDGLLERC